MGVDKAPELPLLFHSLKQEWLVRANTVGTHASCEVEVFRLHQVAAHGLTTGDGLACREIEDALVATVDSMPLVFRDGAV